MRAFLAADRTACAAGGTVTEEKVGDWLFHAEEHPIGSREEVRADARRVQDSEGWKRGKDADWGGLGRSGRRRGVVVRTPLAVRVPSQYEHLPDLVGCPSNVPLPEMLFARNFLEVRSP